ncbi:MAG: cyclase family protein [Haliea sp.]|jgi:kynurenine formamidase|nr:cyclase family protein [Haliea sp.]
MYPAAYTTVLAKPATLTASLILVATTAIAQPAPSPFAGYQLIDLTHAFDENTIYWPTEDPFEHEEEFKGTTEGGWYYTSYRVHTAEHGGTHIDAPIHFAEGKWTADEIPLSSLISPAVVIDVSEAALANPDYQLDLATLRAWEADHGAIPQGAAVLLNTGYAQFWPDRLRYLGTDARGDEGVANLRFPGFSLEAVTYLLEKRGISAVGLDTPSIDYGQSKDFIVHRYLYSHNVLGFENVANLNALPATGAHVVALPMKIRGGSGGPLRIIGLVPSQ